MNNDKIVAIFNDTVTDNALADIAKKHDGLIHDFENDAQFKAARKVNTEMNKLLKSVDTVGIAAAKQVTETRNELKERIETAYSGTVTPFLIEDQKRKDEAKRIKAEKDARIAEQKAKLDLIKGAASRAIHLPVDDIEDILQEVMSIDLDFFDVDMQQEAKAAKDISLASLQEAFKFAEEREEARKAKELHSSMMADKDDEIARLMAMLAEKEPKQSSSSTTSKTVREFLTEYNKKNGYSVDDDCLIETLTESDRVHEDSDIDMHRWYGIQVVVNEIEGVFIMFDSYVITGDNGMSDMGLEYNLDEMSIVQRKERTITEVYYA